MRTFIMLGVLSVHTSNSYLSMTKPMSASFLAIGSLVTSLHFTRESFMFITGLVLAFTYADKPLRAMPFWKKRLARIGIPYLVWTGVYLLFNGLFQPTPHYWLPSVFMRDVRHSIFTGNQFFLYYLFVTMQFYLVFPFFFAWLRKSQRYHRHLFIGSFALQIAITALCKFVVPHTDPLRLPPVLSNIVQYHNEFILTYQFWFVAGLIVALHYESCLNWTKRHARLLFALFIASLVLLWGHYLFDRMVLHETEGIASLVTQPLMVPFSLLLTINLWLAGSKWTDVRENQAWRRFSQFVELGSATSFGMFLLQPLPLVLAEHGIHTLWLEHGATWFHYLLWPICIAVVYTTSTLGTYWLSKVPHARYLVGRTSPIPRPLPSSPVQSATDSIASSVASSG
jgi:peptidoglycan/LPS O-acetylase OafA/YrhL